MTLDGLGYLPLGDSESFDLIGTAGISRIKAKLSIPAASYTDDDTEFGFRVGAGVQYNITETWNARTLVRYQSADFDDIAKNAVVWTAGVNYAF